MSPPKKLESTSWEGHRRARNRASAHHHQQVVTSSICTMGWSTSLKLKVITEQHRSSPQNRGTAYQNSARAKTPRTALLYGLASRKQSKRRHVNLPDLAGQTNGETSDTTEGQRGGDGYSEVRRDDLRHGEQADRPGKDR